MSTRSGAEFYTLLNKAEEILLAMLLAFMTLLTFIQVVLRYVFNSGWVWSLEATTYAFAWLVLIGISYGVRTQSHIAVDLLVRKLPQRMKKVFGLGVIVICLCYAGLMFYGSFVLLGKLYTLGNHARDIAIEKWVLTAIMPVGFAVLALRFIEAGIRVYRGQDIANSHDDARTTGPTEQHFPGDKDK